MHDIDGGAGMTMELRQNKVVIIIAFGDHEQAVQAYEALKESADKGQLALSFSGLSNVAESPPEEPKSVN